VTVYTRKLIDHIARRAVHIRHSPSALRKLIVKEVDDAMYRSSFAEGTGIHPSMRSHYIDVLSVYFRAA
jgi:hypothetical protein